MTFIPQSSATLEHDALVLPEKFRTLKIGDPSENIFSSNVISTAKYSYISFIPKFLFEQFRRYANIFFLCIGLLQQIPDVSPTGRFVTIVPFGIILGLTAIKELIEDSKRHVADRKVNNSLEEVFCYKAEKFVKKEWKNIQVGDLVKVINDKPFPADLILLSSESNVGCNIETANLDGETNLKIRNVASKELSERFSTEESIASQKGLLLCEHPNRMLYEFKGKIEVQGAETIALSNSNILLRGSKLKNTHWIHGIVVYTGLETKLMLNSMKPPLKRSKMEKVTNSQIIMLFVILVVFALSSAFGFRTVNSFGEDHFYVSEQQSNFGFNFLTFIILYNNLIPISLLVTLEFVKFVQAYYVNWDLEIYHEESDTRAAARTSNLNEELGEVKYVFSDKTGTLTQNVMKLVEASVGGRIYPIQESSANELLDVKTNEYPDSIHDFLMLLCVCQSAIPEVVNGNLKYNSSSPDEEALLNGAIKFQYKFLERSERFVNVQTLAKKIDVEFEEEIAFTSSRKRMSVIVKTDKGYKLYTKGADNFILKRLDPATRRSELVLATERHINIFASKGLRTLCLAVRDLDTKFFLDWKQKYAEAKSDVTNNRDRLIEEAAEDMECKLHLVGATGIEDKLQDGVPETIASLLKANIKVWMLTGDKQETAINIGRSCKLLTKGNQLIIINGENLVHTKSMIRKWNDQVELVDEKTELVVDGDSLVYALDRDVRNEFIELCCKCKSVICCRVSPLQKAEMVELVQTHTEVICLSIGDGANDVAMIQRANIGVGISGNEGLQAVNNSDFSIAQFRFLLRLLLVHGAWFNIRNSKVILYSFYKNICLYIIELWFAIYSFWTGQVLFDRWTIALYNILMTSLPPVVIGLFDQNCTSSTRLKHPELYTSTQNSEFFNLKIFWLWMLNALVHSVILFWLPMWAHGYGEVLLSGKNVDYLVLGNVVYSCVVTTVCVKAALTMESWNIYTHLGIWGSVVTWYVFFVIYSYVWVLGIKFAATMAGMVEIVFTSGLFWGSFIFMPVVALTPDLVLKSILMGKWPSLTDKHRIQEKGDLLSKNIMHNDYGTFPTDLHLGHSEKLQERSPLL